MILYIIRVVIRIDTISCFFVDFEFIWKFDSLLIWNNRCDENFEFEIGVGTVSI